MLDCEGRIIDYLRISVTDRCNLRCVYCMPAEGVPFVSHDNILSYEEIIRLAGIFAKMGVSKIKLTGGEPLVRKNLPCLVRGLKSVEGVDCVTLTTNGILLKEQLPLLLDAGLDGVNISLDAVTEETFKAITRMDGVERVLDGLRAAMNVKGLSVKLNCVPSLINQEELADLAALARDKDLAVRFIEMMPIGLGRGKTPLKEETVRGLLEERFGSMEPFYGKLGNGPCRYFKPKGFVGEIGFISSLSHKFCDRCNRVRLTSEGYLKTCLQYDTGVDLKPFLSGDDSLLETAARQAILGKPRCHRFENCEFEKQALEQHRMNEIGG